MPGSHPNPRLRSAVEVMIRLAGPGLDLLLACGDRVSRVVHRDDRGYAVVRMEHPGKAAPRAVAGEPRRSAV
jgi:hypothetical protein